MSRVLRLLALLLLIVPAAPAFAREAPRAQGGVLDLRDWDFARDGPVRLSGEWDFWWGVLADEAAMAGGQLPAPRPTRVPALWPQIQVDGRPLPAEGVGTYRLRVLLPAGTPPLALRNYLRFMAWDVTVDGRRVLWSGTVAADEAAMSTAGHQQLAAIHSTGGELLIVARTAAFGGYGGMAQPLELGPTGGMFEAWQTELALRAGFVSLCVGLALLYLAVHVANRSDRAALAFGLMSLAIAAAELTYNNPLSVVMAGAVPAQLLSALSNVAFPAVWIACLLCGRWLFPGMLPLRWCVPPAMMALLVPAITFGPLGLPRGAQLGVTYLGLAVMVLSMGVISGRAISRKLPLAVPFALSWIVLAASNLALAAGVGFPGVLEAGYCVMLLLQAFVLTSRFRVALTAANGLNRRLEAQVEERTRHLSLAMAELRDAQAQLVRSEKLAGLNRLVAGVAHEINTPMGVALTTATHLSHRVGELSRAFDAGRVTKSAFQEFVEDAREASAMLTASIGRTARLVQSFKQVAADPEGDARAPVRLDEALPELAAGLEAEAHAAGHRLTIEVEPGLTARTYPGALGRVVGELVGNAVHHAFAPGTHGQLWVRARAGAPGEVVLTVEDDGEGVAGAVRDRLFEPFVTTARSRGATGLGLHVVYNLVTGRLGGRVALEDRAEGGTRIVVTIPRDADRPLAQVQETAGA
ncbi:MAG TPA: HAMP domain-containing sensor histidine kinase [Azospirillaceae bacterium]|nr:HAMP domain-containing sensor histidine kinase [Azospirillaceae bacterium]